MTVRGQAGGRVFEVGDKSRKKRMLSSGSCRTEGGEHVLELSIGDRPFLQEWLQSFSGRETARLARVEITGLAPAAG